MAEVCTQEQPSTDKSGQAGQDCKSEDARENRRRRLGVATEDVIDLGQLAVTERSFGSAEGYVGVAADSQVEGVGIVGVR